MPRRAMRAWQAGNRRQTVGPSRFVSAAVKLEFTGQCPVTARAWQACDHRQTIGPARFVSAEVKLEFIALALTALPRLPLEGKLSPKVTDEV